MGLGASGFSLPPSTPWWWQPVDALAKRPSLQVLLLLAALGWVAHFFAFRKFGLYEDDYFFISYAIGDNGFHLADIVRDFTSWPEGRPIGFLLPPLFSSIGNRLGGLSAIYVLGFLVVTLNAFLFYLMLRIHYAGFVALTGALFFLLYPADTTKILLTHSIGLQPSLTFLLLAMILYLRGQKTPAYLVASCSLLVYEMAFMPFFAVPLLKQPWNRRLLMELARHALVLIGIMAAVVLVRLLLGEERLTTATAGAGLVDILPRAVASVVLGPIWNLWLFLYGPLREVPGWNLATLLSAAAAALVLFWVIAHWSVDEARQTRSPSAENGSSGSRGWWMVGQQLGQFADLFRLLLAGIVLLAFGYALAFLPEHYPPFAVQGRMTSVHLAANVGSAVIFAALAAAAMRIAARYRLRAYAAGGLTLYLALLVGYHVTIQRDLARSWEIQRAFWTQVVDLCPDMQEGTLILFRLEGGQQARFILSNSWADAIVLEQLYRFPGEWSGPPRLFSVGPEWIERVEVREGQLWWRVPEALWYEYWAILPQSNVIYLELADGRLHRRGGSISLLGHTLTLKDPAPVAQAPRVKSALFDYLIHAGNTRNQFLKLLAWFLCIDRRKELGRDWNAFTPRLCRGAATGRPRRRGLTTAIIDNQSVIHFFKRRWEDGSCGVRTIGRENCPRNARGDLDERKPVGIQSRCEMGSINVEI